MTDFALTIENETVRVRDLPSLRKALKRIELQDFAEIWLTADSGERFCLLKSHSVAMLMFLRGEGDSGFVSYNPASSQQTEDAHTFILSNGQHDEYPASMCVPIEEGLKAVEDFFILGEKASRIDWKET